MQPWGKAQNGRYHHLAHHCADVASCFEVLAQQLVIRSRLEAAAERPLSTQDISRLAVLAFLHDIGKLHPGFQAKAWVAQSEGVARVGHLVAGHVLFCSRDTEALHDALGLRQVCSWGVEPGVLLGVLAHHGRPFDFEDDNAAERNWGRQRNGYDAHQSAIEIGQVLPKWFAPAFAHGGDPLPAAPRFQHLLCGLVTLADWLGSTEALFAYEADLSPTYIEVARDRAERAIARVGLDPERHRSAVAGRTDFQTLTGFATARPAQWAVADASLDDPLLILEAETGSGKTEAALWRFNRLLEAGKVDSLYFALPTRAAAKQIHRRVTTAMRNVFGADAPEAVLAIPGYQRAGEAEGTALPGWKVRWDDDDGSDERALLSRWAAESNKRFLAATIAVGTVDQAMLAGLQVKHAHVRAAALSRSLLVIDEVHASDPYMVGVQRSLLSGHIALGGHAMLMSATLGSDARTRWLNYSRGRGKHEAFEAAVARPYPAVWSSGRTEPAYVERDGRQKAVVMELKEDWSPATAARLAAEAAARGAKVLLVRNTVTEAQRTFAALAQSPHAHLLWQVCGAPALHHARFAVEDRALLDAAVERTLSPRPDQRPHGGCIVIGTQTLEQSLDIDADMLITDLCPVDVLLQRIGRLHRHRVARPGGFEQARCVVLSPHGGLDRFTARLFENGLGCFTTKQGIGGVYINLPACELTRQLILDHREWAIPDMNRILVESATHEDKINDLCAARGSNWQNYWDNVSGKHIAEAQSAHNVALPFQTDFSELPEWPSKEESIRTRLGAEGVRLDFVSGTIGPFGSEISSITLPAHLSAYVKVPDTPLDVRTQGSSLQFTVESHAFTYDRSGLSKGFTDGDAAQPSD